MNRGSCLIQDNYLQQYIVFRLKVADAISDGIDTTREFINELSGYRTSLHRIT